MANEVFTRTPTSTGNRKKFTWAGWIKRNDIDASGGNSYQGIFAVGTVDGSEDTFMFSSDQIRLRCETGTDITTSQKYRDPGNWMHVMMVVDTTLFDPDHRCIFYVNGVKSDSMANASDITQNADLRINSAAKHYIGEFPRINNHLDGQISDVFLVDGQALTPDVFGFYKDGDGYMSSGTTQATDFKPGQWMPHSPRKIKSDVERRGGFGVNGYYLPMNDSSNPGADFHCTPNSIIKLKGEDLPQPRNGAPSTYNSYVGQLRQETGTLGFDGVASFDGAGDYLSIADNADFAFGTGDFTVEAFVFATGLGTYNTIFDTSSTGQDTTGIRLGVESTGRLYLYTNGFFLTANNAISTGRWYHVAYARSSGTHRLFINGVKVDETSTARNYTNDSCVIGSHFSFGESWEGFISNLRVVKGSAVYTANFTPPTEALTNVTNTKLLCCNSSTSATASTVTPGTITANGNAVATRNELTGSIVLAVPGIAGGQGSGYGDYSADIRGSGTNKTLTASGNATVASVSSYYGSALSFDGTGDYFEIAESNNEYDLDGDYTIEFWVNLNTINTVNDIIGTANNSAFLGSGKSGWVIGYTTYSNIGFRFGYQNSGSWTFEHHTELTTVANQWNHVAITRSGSTQQIIINGVVSYAETQTNTITSTENTLRIGGGFGSTGGLIDAQIQDLRIYKGVAKYKGGFDVPKPYTPVGIEAFRTTADTCKNNFATWNPLLGPATTPLADGNLSVTNNGVHKGTRSTIGVTSGKWYWEYRVGSVVVNSYVGVSHKLTSEGFTGGDYFLHGTGNNNFADPSGSLSVTNGSFTTGMIIGCAFDYDAGTLDIYKNGTLAVEATGGDFGGKSIHAHLSFNASFSDEWVGNFGQNPSFNGKVTAGTNTDGNGKGLFKYAVPSGFLALCEDNLPTPTIADPGKYFKTVLYSGDGNVGHSIAGVGFQPDLVWLKERSSTSSHQWHDSVRGAGNPLFSNSTAVESYSATYLYSLDSDGFTLGTSGGVNASTDTYVAWCWKAGGAAVTNNDGTITSQVSANQTAGFSIVSLNTGSGGNFTVGHGLANAPKFFITKARNQTYSWTTYHHSIGNNKYVYLNSTAAPVTTTSVWQNTAPSSSVIYGNSTNWGTADYIIYAWAEIEGYSKFGSYIGNGNTDGPFVYCGFKPAWVMVKRSTTGANEGWTIFDSSRGPFNPNPKQIYANSNIAEGDASGRYKDFVSNGFKIRGTSGEQNTSGITYIFMAFAESPFQIANAK